MPAGLLLPEDVGPADAVRVLGFLNTVANASELADTVGFSEGPSIGRVVAAAILAQRSNGPFLTLDDLMAVTGVTHARFTEIVMALSGARPPAKAAARTIQIRPSAERLLLGQRIGLVAQVLDTAGRGVEGVEVTCVTTWGTLTARSGTDLQRGASAKLVTEPGGLIRLTIDPPIFPPLSDLARAMLEVELSHLAAASAGEAKIADALASFAEHYRAEAAEPLRTAVDRVFACFPAEALTPEVGWTVVPITLIAFAGGEAADTVGLATLPVRSWLAAFLAALRASVAGDRRTDGALANLRLERTSGDLLARGIFAAQEAFAGLDRGVLGQKFGDEIAGDAVGRFLNEGAARIDRVALVDAVRAGGASAAAIKGGGFAVFDAIGAVRDVEEAAGVKVRLTAGIARDVAALDARIAQVESDRLADRTALEARIGQIDANQVTKTDLAALDTRIGRIEADRITKEDLTALETRLDQRVADDITAATGGLRNELGVRIDAKADLGTVSGLQRSVSGLQAETKAIDNRIDAVDRRVTALSRR